MRPTSGMFIPISDWFPAFVLTLAVELPIAVTMLRGTELGPSRLVVLVAVVNLATHLAVWYVLSQLLDPGSAESTLVAETWAVAVESIFYLAAIRGLSVSRAVGVAVVANVASFAAGRLIRTLGPAAIGLSLSW